MDTKMKARLGERWRGTNRSKKHRTQKGENMKVNRTNVCMCGGEGRKKERRGDGGR